jgi:hypothetical protein
MFAPSQQITHTPAYTPTQQPTLKAICQGYYREHRKILRNWEKLTVTGAIKLGNPHGTKFKRKPKPRKPPAWGQPRSRGGYHKLKTLATANAGATAP